MSLSSKQKAAFDSLKFVGSPCGLNTILANTSMVFDSKAQLKEVLKQLISLGKVTLQGNGQYKVSVIAKEQQKKTPVKRVNSVKQTKVINQDQVEQPVNTENNENKVGAPDKKVDQEEVSVIPLTLEQSLASLQKKLTKGELSINDYSLKIEVLQRLSALLSDDISDVLNDIAKDLITANAA
ncbi:MAG: hypothetical protein ACPGUD_14785 [Parashewanella sp.]